ncbi:MAG: methyltransferase domain-containing protein [Pyrinomonadaceae bacterium]
MESWDSRYAQGKYSTDRPHRLLIGLAEELAPGRALDLACGTGRHANYLAGKGWQVTAVDSSPVGLGIARRRAGEKGLEVEYLLADLEKGEFGIEPDSFDLICDFYYLQRDLFEAMKLGVRPGGRIVSTVHLYDEGDESPFLLNDGELAGFFADFRVLHFHETSLTDRDPGEHHRRTAEIIAQRPYPKNRTPTN